MAVDLRGYGRSSKPTAIDAYRMREHVNDNVGLVHALGSERAALAEHARGCWRQAV